MEEKLYLHAILVNKSVGLDVAKQVAANITKKKYYKESGEVYNFRNIPKTAFVPDSFVAKPVNENLTLVFGNLRGGYKN